MSKRLSALLVAALAVSPLLGFKYKIKDLQIRPAREYASFQDFQNLVIAAYPYSDQERVDQIFDTDKLIEKGFLAILVVIENNNSFPVQIQDKDIYLVDSRGQRERRLHYSDVLLSVSLDKPPSAYSPKDLQRKVDKQMRIDFEHKAFVERLVAPNSSDYGIVFFKLPEEGDLEGYSLYLPQIVNFSTQELLIFFEFELKDASQ